MHVHCPFVPAMAGDGDARFPGVGVVGLRLGVDSGGPGRRRGHVLDRRLARRTRPAAPCIGANLRKMARWRHPRAVYSYFKAGELRIPARQPQTPGRRSPRLLLVCPKKFCQEAASQHPGCNAGPAPRRFQGPRRLPQGSLPILARGAAHAVLQPPSTTSNSSAIGWKPSLGTGRPRPRRPPQPILGTGNAWRSPPT